MIAATEAGFAGGTMPGHPGHPSDILSVATGNHRWDRNPFIVIWEITRACALACRHCRAEAKVKRDPMELNAEEARLLIDQVARIQPQIFILTGGDPMMRSDLLQLVEYAAGKGLRVAISPSATPRWLNADLPALHSAGVSRISLSIDGAKESTHDLFRGIPGTWGRTMQGIDAAKKAGLSIQINTTITRQNLQEIPEFIELLNEIEPAMWSLFQLVPTGRALSEDMIDADEMETLFETLADLSPTVRYGIKTTEGHHFRRVLIQRGKAHKGSPGMQGIADGKGFVFISHTGEVCPSGFLPFVAGNVRERELGDIYQNAPIFRELRDTSLLDGKCGICEFRSLCGGSRARAYAMTGNYLASEPLCAYIPPPLRKTEQ